MNTASPSTNAGFTLIELVISLVILAVLMPVLYQSIDLSIVERERGHRLQMERDNAVLAKTHLTYAYKYNNGFLLPPYTGGSLNSAPIDTTNPQLLNVLANGSLPTDRYNTDGKTAQNVKTYELLSPQPCLQHPIAGSSSETVTLCYDRGVIYQTSCAKADATCNTGVPGSSSTYAATGWVSTFPDIAAIELSSLNIQESTWSETYLRLNELRRVIRDTFALQVQQALPADRLNNHFFKPDLGTSPDLSGADPLTNQGCRDGWYDASSADVNIIEFYALSPKSLYGETPWGGRIEICRDFDPNNGGVDVLPHIGALRINKAVTSGLAPSATKTENLILII